MKRFFSRRVLMGGSVGAAIIAAAALGAAWFGAREAPPEFQGRFGAFAAHDAPRPAPPIRLADASGTPRTLADFAGRVVLLNYWATWCAPCVEEMPSLDKLQARLGGPQFAVVAVSVDRQGAAVAAPFLEKLGVKRLETYLDPKGETMRAFGVRGLPTTLLIDAQGREVGRLEGSADWSSPQAEALVRHYLPKG